LLVAGGLYSITLIVGGLPWFFLLLVGFIW